MGESKKNPKLTKDGTIALSVRLPPGLHTRLLERSRRDGMKLGGLIERLLEFGLAETETVLLRKGTVAPASKAGTTAEPRRRAGGE